MATIYKIWSEKGEKVYIGSTTQTLTERWRVHKAYRHNNYTSKILLEEYGVETCSIEEIEKVDLDKRYERERFWIENVEHCVNRFIPGRSSAEYYQENKDRLLEKQKAYYQENKEHIIEYNKAHYREIAGKPVVCVCGAVSTKKTLKRHLKSKAHLAKVETLPQTE